MSNEKWREYSQILMDKGIVLGFAIYSRNSKQMWTSTPGFRMKSDELEYIMSGFIDDTDIRLKGFWIEGRHYTMTRLSTNRVMMCGRDTINGTGCVVYPCKSCILIATHSGQQITTCYSAIEKFGDILSRNGF